MSKKTYILQKYLPDSKAGDEYILNNSDFAYYKEGNVYDRGWQRIIVENNPEWFKLKEEQKPYVSDAKYNGHTYIFTLNMGTEQSKTVTIERERLAKILLAEDKH